MSDEPHVFENENVEVTIYDDGVYISNKKSLIGLSIDVYGPGFGVQARTAEITLGTLMGNVLIECFPYEGMDCNLDKENEDGGEIEEEESRDSGRTEGDA